MWSNIKSTPIARKVSRNSASGRLSASGAFCSTCSAMLVM
ncbi:Uncharacterised protein [Mycobacterium tuberculosis]|nr:Uncharacterised protein [Mycobacterium tuberculosis]COY77239.1 Uncharacterised protein [Mycobacterium tuberculosis]